MATVTTTPPGVGQPGSETSQIRQTLDATVAQFVATLRGAQSGTLPIAGMHWRVGELGAHVAQTATVFTQAARGETTAYGEGGRFNAGVDQKLVDGLEERDPARLGSLVEERYAALRAAFAARRDDDIVPQLQNYSIAGINALWVLDLNVHGYQIGRAAGRPFSVDNQAVRLGLATVVPFAMDPDGARGLHATYAMHIKGTKPLVYTVDDGDMRVEPAARVDCHLGVDPVAFLLVTLGVMPQWRAAATFKMRAWGRRPWLAGRMSKLFPTVPHGGIVRA